MQIHMSRLVFLLLMLFFFPADLMPMSSKRVNSTTVSVTRVKVDGEPLQRLEVL